MAKKLFLLSTVLYVLLFFGLPGEVLGDVADQLEQANAYLKDRNYEQAEAIYKAIVGGYPGTDDALMAQKQLTILYIKQNNQTQAEENLQKLLTDFSGHKDIAKAANEVGDNYYQLKKYSQACEIFQHVVDTWPQAEYAKWSLKSLVKSNILLGDDETAEAAFERLISEYSNDKDIARLVYIVAGTYRWQKRYTKACEVYQYVVDRWPEDKYAMKSREGIVKSNILLGDDEAAFERLISEYSNDKNIARLVYIVAGTYRWQKRYTKACEVYQYVVDRWPEDKYAMKSREGIVKSNIALGNAAAAEAGVDELLAKFSGREDIAKIATSLADEYSRKSENYDATRQLYQHVLSHWPNEECAIWAQCGIVSVNIKLGDYEAADASIETMLAKYSDHNDLPKAFCQLGDDYLEAGQNDKAIECYQYVINKQLDGRPAILSHVGIARVHIALGDDEAVTAVIDNLIADYPDLPRAVFQVGEEYYFKAFQAENEGLEAEARENFRKAIATWERIIEELPVNASHNAQAYYFSGSCSAHLGEYEKAIEYYQKVVDTWPNHRLACSVLLRISKMYKFLMRNGVMSDSEGWGAVKVVYRQMVEQYPDCSAAEVARRWLERFGKFYEGVEK